MLLLIYQYGWITQFFRNEMFRTWEEKVKYKFGNSNSHEGFEITVAGVPDDESKNVEDGFHTIPS
jgi:hypothetical protein